MHEYDVTLKTVLTRGARVFLSQLTGMEVTRWHNSELPDIRTRRADLLGETADGGIIHVELQSTNDPRMAYRMLEYLVAIEHTFNQIPRQLVLYVGEAPLRMSGRLSSHALSFECAIRDIRELDSEPLLESASLGDNIISILARLEDRRAVVRRILEKIAAGAPPQCAVAFRQLSILSALRSLTGVLAQETKQMPILNDFYTDLQNDEYFGPLIRQRMAERHVEGERSIILRQMSKRFGVVPNWVTQRLESLNAQELEDLSVRFLDAQSLEQLFS